jgi:hypothetical protein
MAAPQFATPQRKVPPTPKARFTLAEANRALPLVQRIVRDIVTTHRRAADTQAKLEGAPSIKEAMTLEAELELAVDRLQDFVEELDNIGCELKDREMGLVDFPGRHQQRDVYLCWRLGEEKVESWHETTAGYSGRQPISTLEESA